VTAVSPARVGFRRDIEGLRAVAVGLVVLYHAGLPWLSGGYIGVDVFFVISGFLMTALIVREIDSTGRVSLPSFYARRIRRLLPAAALVLVTTLAAAKLLLPPLALPVIKSAGIATALYGSNIWFALDGTDYLANDGPSPLQHFWSLAVEEQFYLVWPLLLLIAYRRSGRRRVSGRALAVFCATSFLLCVIITTVRQPWAFFSLPTRAWELGVGGLVALSVARGFRLPDTAARVAGWTGLAVVASAAVLFSDTTPFPGYAAAVPVLGTAALLLGGHHRLRGSADALLVPAPMQFVGRLSYSIYLWHWPVLVLPAMRYGALAPASRVALVALTVLLAWLTSRLVEDPVRHSGWMRDRHRRSFALAAVVTTVAVATAGLVGVLPRLATDVSVPPLTAAQAAQEVPPPSVVPANVAPPLMSVADDYPEIYADGCHGNLFSVTPRACEFGQQDASRSIFLVGDSHAGQWFPALKRMSEEDGWRLASLTKSACPSSAIPVPSEGLRRDYVECRTWLDAVVDRIRAEHPDIVVLGNWSISYIKLLGGDGAIPRWIDGLRAFIARLPPSIPVVLLGDTPTWAQPPVNCLSEHIRSPAACSQPVGDLLDERLYAAEASLAGGRVTFVPTYKWLCNDVCQGLDRNVVMYRDFHHVSATMSGLLVDRVRAAIRTVAHPSS
jgi:peptidoglycan/LPS O-acetylase OafA/YrhL